VRGAVKEEGRRESKGTRVKVRCLRSTERRREKSWKNGGDEDVEESGNYHGGRGSQRRKKFQQLNKDRR